ncbi:hypothetical protein E2C01_034927 [Portunus trituberculatus]|uniref:Uncharacterized protein n=1 Tax=Portunus trituberculatus TaxID=210409 RepID=A0A5B7F7Y1_PORTR|nr:hypothetical protein [Portunus trituberculatus]
MSKKMRHSTEEINQDFYAPDNVFPVIVRLILDTQRKR